MKKITILTENLNSNEVLILKQGEEQIKLLVPNLEFSYKTTEQKFTSITFANNVASGYILDNTQILPLVDGSEDIVCLIYDWSLIVPQPTNPSTTWIKKGNCIPMAIPKQWYNGFVEIFVEFFLHELDHAEAFRSGKQDLTHFKYDPMWNGKWNSKTNIDYYLFLLSGYITAAPVTPVISPTPTTYPTLKKGSKGSAVKILQTKINEVMNSTLLIDGDFGIKTQAVVYNFQAKKYLKVDGIVGPKTWQVLMGKNTEQSMTDIISNVCTENGVEPIVGIAVATCESSLNPKATFYNKGSNSTDRGLFQWNDKYHPEITDDVAFDPKQATKLFCDAVKQGKLHAYWSASQPCWSTKIAPDLLKKYGIV